MDRTSCNKASSEPQSLQSTRIALEKYIPSHLWNRLNFKDLSWESEDIAKYVKPLFSSPDMRRYGTPKELAANIIQFCDFTGSHKVFGDDPCNFYFTQDVFYHNAKKETFVSKQDIFVCLQRKWVEEWDMGGREYQMSLAIIAAYLKSHEAKLESVHEFVRLDDLNNSFNTTMFEELGMKLSENTNLPHQSTTQITIDEVFEKIRKIVPGWNDEDYAEAGKLIHKMWNICPAKKRRSAFTYHLDVIRLMVKSIDSTISAFPQIYLPVDHDSITTRYVRLFEDGDGKFVMTDELKRVALVPKNKLSKRYLTTVDEKTALELIRTKAHYHGSVEFVIVPIKRANHSAVPIRTPDKGYCKLAFDILMELINDLIFGAKIFQKLKRSEWYVIEEFFKKLEHHFNPKEKEPYFIRLEHFEKDQMMIKKYFEQYDDRPTKNNRNAKADGFTAQNLKNELVYLGFEELFPDITSVADQMYEATVKSSKGPILQTSDLFTAVGQCVTCSLFLNLLDIAVFVNNQSIKRCASQTGVRTTLNIDTKWKWIDMADIKVEDINNEKRDHGVVNRKLILPDGNQLFYNDSACSEAFRLFSSSMDDQFSKHLGKYLMSDDLLKSEVFLMDSEDVNFLSNEYDKDETIESITDRTSSASRNIVTFGDIFPSKKLYLRTFWLSPIDRKENGLVFFKEVLELCTLALHQQLGRDKLYEVSERIRRLFDENSWKHGRKAALNMKELKELFELLDVDKSRITLVPDILYASAVMRIKPVQTTITLISPEREDVFDMSQAVFKVFQEVVCDIDWSKKSPESSNPNSSLYLFQSKILTVMKKLTEPKKFFQITEVEECVKHLKTNEHYQKCKQKQLLTPHIKLFDCDVNDTITVAFFLSECEKYGIQYKTPPGMNKRMLYTTSLRSWKARLLFLYEWNNMFFDLQSDLKSKYGDIKTLITNGIYHATPLDNWKSEADFKTLIIGTDHRMQEDLRMVQLASLGEAFYKETKQHEWLKNTSWRDRTYIKRFRKWEVLEKLHNSPTPEISRRVHQERTILHDEAVNEETERNDRNFAKIMTEIVKYSESLKKASALTDKVSGKKAVPPKHPKNQESLVVDENSQQENLSKEKEIKKNLNSKKQKSNSSVSVLGEGAVENLKTSESKSESKDQKENSDPLKAQRKEMDEMKQMIKILQEEVRENKQPVGKTVPLETHQKEVNELRIKLEHLDDKCRRTSDLCNERSRELKTAKQKLEKLEKKESVAEKKLKEIQEKEKGMPTREELQKELEKAKKRADKLEKDKATEQKNFKKKMEQMEKEKADQIKLLQESIEANEQLKQDLKSQQLTSSSETELLNSRITELESFYSESQERIRFLKQQFSKEVVRGFDFRPSLEMRKTLTKMRTDQDTLLAGKQWDIALKKVIKLEKMTEDPKVRNIAQYWLTDYKEKLSEFSSMISENIKRITADQFITSSELLPMFEFPVLNDYIETETTKAQQAINEKIERECFCCFTEGERDGGWWRCPGCLKRGHQICVGEAWLHSGIRLCPLCRFEVV